MTLCHQTNENLTSNHLSSQRKNKCFTGLITFVISIAMATIFMPQLNLKRLTLKMFGVLQVTSVVDSQRLENLFFLKVEKKLN